MKKVTLEEAERLLLVRAKALGHTPSVLAVGSNFVQVECSVCRQLGCYRRSGWQFGPIVERTCAGDKRAK